MFLWDVPSNFVDMYCYFRGKCGCRSQIAHITWTWRQQVL